MRKLNRRAVARTPERRGSLWPPALLVLLALAAAWRWAYLARLADTPFAGSLDGDSRIYWTWSEYILRFGVVPPAPFFLAPLYPYFLALARILGAASVADILRVQLVLGTAAVGLLADATRRVAGLWPAGLVGVLLALCGPLTFFDALVLPESLLFALESLLVWHVVVTRWPEAGPGRNAVYGVLVGVLSQGRATEAVLLLLAWPLAGSGSPRSTRRFVRLAAAVSACLACTLPSVLANARASHEWIPFTYSLGYNLYIGNHPDASGAYGDVTGGSMPVPLRGTPATTGGALDGRAYLLAAANRRLSPAASSRAWADMALEYVRSNPMKAILLQWKKACLIWNAREIPQMESMRSFARAAGPLGLPVAGSFGFLAILGLTGLALGSQAGQTGRWLASYLLLSTMALVPFFVTERYRLHLLPALAVLAGIAAAGIARWVRAMDVRSLSLASIVLLLATMFVSEPGREANSGAGEWAMDADRAMRYLDRGRYPEAVGAFAQADMARGPVGLGPGRGEGRIAMAAFCFRYGIALEAVGCHASAIQRWEQAVRLDSNDAGSLGRLLLAYESGGQSDLAARVRAQLDSVPAGRAQIFLDDGWRAAERGDYRESEKLFREALEEAPDLSMAWQGLLRLLIQEDRLTEAAPMLQQARASGLEVEVADIFECYLGSRSGKRAEAEKLLESVRRRPPPSDAYLEELIELSSRMIRRANPGERQ